MAGQNLTRKAQLTKIERLRIVRIYRRRLEPATVAEHFDQKAAGGVDVSDAMTVPDRQVPSAPLLQPRRVLAVTLLEEWPVEIGAVRHQFPSNTGFSFATKAR